MKTTGLMLAVLAAGAACGGPPRDRPLGPGYGKATAAQCSAAVENYERLKRDADQRRDIHGHVKARPSPNAPEERAHRIELCQIEEAATEADCVAHAASFGEAEECAPNWTW